MPYEIIYPAKSVHSEFETRDFRLPVKHEMELRDLLHILQRRKSIVLAVFLLGIVLAGVSGLFVHKEYSSTATVEVNKDQENALGLRDLSGTPSNPANLDDLNSDLLTQQAVITSDNIAMRVIEKLKLYRYPPYSRVMNPGSAVELGKAPLRDNNLLHMFRSRLKVSLVKGTRLITITYTDPDPVRSTEVANAVVDAYMTDFTQSRFQATTKASSWLANQLLDLKNKVSETQARVDKYQQESGLVGMTIPPDGFPGWSPANVPSANSIPLERLNQLNRDLTSAEVSRIAKEAVYRMTQSQDPDSVLGEGSATLAQSLGADTVLSPGSPDVTLLQQLRQRQSQLEMQLAAATTKYGARNPLIMQLRNEEATEAGQIRTEMGRIRAQAKNDFTMATIAENAIRGRIAAQEEQVHNVSTKAEQLLMLEQEAYSSRQLYQDLYTKLQEATIAAGINASKITLVDQARIPVRPSSPRELMRIVMGGALGLVCGLLAAYLWEYFDDTITTPEQIEQVTPVRLLGVIPGFPVRRKALPRRAPPLSIAHAPPVNPDAWVIHAPQSHVSEAYRGLRTALLARKQDSPATVVAVISGAPQEGKSITCFNTASAFAIQGNRVLYVDADLRRPSEGRMVSWSDAKGLSDYLSGSMPVAEIIHPSAEVESLFIMPAGGIPNNPAELIGSKRFKQMLEELKGKYDYIFLDTPPILLVTDGQLLSLYADGYMFVLRAGKTTREMLRHSLSLLETSHARPLGIVLNGMNLRAVRYPMYRNDRKGSAYYVEPQLQV